MGRPGVGQISAQSLGGQSVTGQLLFPALQSPTGSSEPDTVRQIC